MADETTRRYLFVSFAAQYAIKGAAPNRDRSNDTPVRVLDPSKRIDGIGKGVKEGRIWAYVRYDRPWGNPAPPGAAYFFSVDRKCENPQRLLAGFSGTLQADA